MAEKYLHESHIHNLESPKEMVPMILKLIQPKSVVDFGCGIGTFIKCFQDKGVEKVLGIDGSWVNQDLLKQYMNPEDFKETDLEKPITLDQKYDLVISLEVAEHLQENAADTFVQSLISAGDVILFSAAIPKQGGQNHINEQWLSYWEQKFKQQGFQLLDIVRPLIWDNPKIYWWYRQNTVIFIKNGKTLSTDFAQNPIKDIVHYELFSQRIASWNHRYDKVLNGELPTKDYIKLLLKSILKKDRYESLKNIFRKK